MSATLGVQRSTCSAWGPRARALTAFLACACALAFGAAWGAARASASQPYKFAIYSTVGSSHQGLTGHVFVQLRHGATDEIFGKYPGGWWVFDTNGEIRDDGPTRWGWRITYTISQAKWAEAQAYVSSQRVHPDTYRLLSDNCVEFAVEVARRAGVEPPPYQDLGVPEPTALTRHLSLIGSGNTYHEGLVLENPDDNVTASGAPDPPPPVPPCCDVAKILDTALSNPHRLANDLRLEFRQYHLRRGHLAANDTYRIEVTHTNVHQNLYAVRWGDGSSTRGVEPRTSSPGTVAFHHHNAPGWRGSVTVVVLQNGRVLEYVQSLGRGRRGSGLQIDRESPPPPPRAFPPPPPA
jgi:hypothetical protein